MVWFGLGGVLLVVGMLVMVVVVDGYGLIIMSRLSLLSVCLMFILCVCEFGVWF